VSSGFEPLSGTRRDSAAPDVPQDNSSAVSEAEATLRQLAEVFLENRARETRFVGAAPVLQPQPSAPGRKSPQMEARYRALVEQVPAVVFMAYLDRGIGEAYVSPQIEAALGFSQQEWLEDPVRWYSHIHPDDKQRWSVEAAEMFLSGKPLRSAYRVIARDGRVLWFQCEAKMMRNEDGSPSFIHGVGFDITELKRAQEALQEERNVLSAILDTVGALVVVLDSGGRIVRFNRACEQMTGYGFSEIKGKRLWDLFQASEEIESFAAIFNRSASEQQPRDYEGNWLTRDGAPRLVAWSSTVQGGDGHSPKHIIVTGIDITERKRLERAILEISVREQRRIGQDLHDGLGQHLTGIAFMSKVLEERLSEKGLAEAADAQKIVKLVNEAINKTRELSRGLLPVVTEAHGLMTALRQWAVEVEDLFHITCRLQCDEPVLISDVNRATHLYHIAQEAVNNAIKHGKPQRISIRLHAANEEGTLVIVDDGPGIENVSTHHTGMGLNIMNYRARMIGGSLELGPGPGGGTAVTCIFPLRS
jgi:PAS domain S-box-containing protein